MYNSQDHFPSANQLFNHPFKGQFRPNIMVPMQNINSNFSPKFNQQQQPQVSNFRPPFQGISRTQQMMKALPRSNMSTGFKIPPRPNMPQPIYSVQQQYPRPMSGVTHPPARTLPPTPQYRQQQQLNVNETCDPYFSDFDYATDNYYEYCPETYITDYNYDQNVVTISEPQTENFTQNEDENFCKDQLNTAPE